MVKCPARGLVAGLILALVFTSPAAAQGSGRGTILRLIAIGAWRPGNPIRVASAVWAQDAIQQSNLYYEMRAPSGAIVATRTVDPGRLRAGQVFVDAWSTSNTPEVGTYTVSLCWSTGNSRNCNIDYAETSFYSVPTLGPAFSVLALALLGFWLWSQRAKFAAGSA
ncbi:MAG: hypothetical protein AB1449_12110 [Chloroflexota bacterium]